MISSVEEGNIKVGEFTKIIMFKNSQATKEKLTSVKN
jgi:hypothetical protein